MARVLFVMALLATSVNVALADVAYVLGADYLAMPPVQRTVFVSAAMDMQVRLLDEFAPEDDAAAFIERVMRCTKGMTSDQLRNFVDEYMARDPVYATYTMVSNFRAALHAKCPA